MSTNPPENDAYEKVLADLRARRDQIDQAITAIEAIRGGSAAPASSISTGTGPNIGIDSPGAFLGLSIVEAAKKLLAAKRQPLKNPQIVDGFKAGGFILKSKDPINTVGAVLTRRSNDVGDIVKVGRGTWGLREWFPGRNFARKGKTENNGDKGEASEASEPEGEPVKAAA